MWYREPRSGFGLFIERAGTFATILLIIFILFTARCSNDPLPNFGMIKHQEPFTQQA